MKRYRPLYTGAASALLLVSGLLAGCSSSHSDASNGGCPITPNGTHVSVAAPPASGDIANNPEIGTGYRTDMTSVRTHTYAVSTANPLSTQAACRVLASGGTAADALVAAQMVLGLVEPQATGIGGGAFMLYYNAANKTIDAYDGRETAPASATENYLRWVSDTDQTTPHPSTRASGRSIGVPGVLRLLEAAHNDHGKQPWHDLFTPAIDMADNGFAISPRMGAEIAATAKDLAGDDNAKAYFLHPDGSPKPIGTTITDPAFGKALSTIAAGGANAFYTGPLAHDIVDAAGTTSNGRTASQITLADLAAYQAKKRTAVCTDYRTHTICGMPGPSSGGITVASALGILENFDLSQLGPDRLDRNGGVPKAQAVHLISEAERLAYADRDKYVADPDFVPLPGGTPDTLLNKPYLKQRAALINPAHTMGTAQPGDFGAVPVAAGPQQPEHGTSHISVVDKYGNAATMTTTVESSFGSFHMVDGFILNNQLTDFSASPTAPDGTPVANRVQAGKRPRSSMSPTLVFDHNPDGTRGPLAYVTGSPGGGMIPEFVVKTLVALLDWNLDPQQAVSLADFGAQNTPVTGIGGEDPDIDTADNGDHNALVQQLRAMGHQVSVVQQSSGLSALKREPGGWIGGADPRREGVVMGDTY
ncbi:gamma-glutamyltransferase [Nocardia sp. NEAU-G5]|uniref:Glutathione hydrolase proenzyme n=1 Tax=Nocardia albiluteola TaxID=2842303 RepID=A0ABS6AW75_9NOCA|nr:gamma-glutamyltransferase [Nocardia albiluteola]MBU3062298.1 gamma-glutamyltransferase [Nocardia albiluteola]